MTPCCAAEQMRQVDRGLKKSGRELEREIKKLQMDEKKTLAEIKKLASQGQQVSITRVNCAQGPCRGYLTNS